MNKFEGWYADSTKIEKVPDNSNINVIAKFAEFRFIAVGRKGYIISPSGAQQAGTHEWHKIAFDNGKYVVTGYNGYVTSSTDVENWSIPEELNDSSGNPLSVQLNDVYVIP